MRRVILLGRALASPYIDDVNGSRVRPSVRPRTSRRLRMRDIHVIYADSNSADFAGFRNRLLLKWSQCKHSRRNECRYPEFESVFGQCSGPSPAPSSYTSSKKGTVRRDWNDVDNRNGRDVLEKRQRRETEGAVFETRGTGKEDGLDVLRDVLLRLRSLSAYVHVYIRELAHARPPMPSISLYSYVVVSIRRKHSRKTCDC